MTPKSNCVGLSKRTCFIYLLLILFLSLYYMTPKGLHRSQDRKKRRKSLKKTETPATFKTFIFDYVFLHFNLFLGRKVEKYT